jgi:hypothetical protein
MAKAKEVLAPEAVSAEVETPSTGETLSAAAGALKGSAPVPAAVAQQTVTFTMADLANILASANAQGREQTQALVDAILEARKPYKDPNRERVMRNVRRKMREQLNKQDAQDAWDQANCQHLQGSHGRIPGQLTAIIHHVLDNGEMIGICLICQRVFRSCDADYMKQMQRPSGCETSSSGRRSIPNLAEAIATSQEGHRKHALDGRIAA